MSTGRFVLLCCSILGLSACGEERAPTPPYDAEPMPDAMVRDAVIPPADDAATDPPDRGAGDVDARVIASDAALPDADHLLVIAAGGPAG